MSRSIIQLAENQSRSLDFILVGQQSQMDAYREMTRSNQAREDDALFAGIDVYDGEDPSKFEGWLDAVEQACNMTDRNLHKELMKKSSGAIRETISMMSAAWTDDDIISKLRQEFSSMSTMNRAREELKDLKQLPGQPISLYMYKYGRIHFLTTGNQARNERYPTAIMEFIKSLNPKLIRALVKKHADPRTRPQMLQQAFNMAEEASRRILETESFERSSTVRFVGSVNNIYQHASQKSMKYHVEDKITPTTKEATTKVIVTKVRMITMVRRIGIRTPKVPTRRKKIRKNPRTRTCT